MGLRVVGDGGGPGVGVRARAEEKLGGGDGLALAGNEGFSRARELVLEVASDFLVHEYLDDR